MLKRFSRMLLTLLVLGATGCGSKGKEIGGTKTDDGLDLPSAIESIYGDSYSEDRGVDDTAEIAGELSRETKEIAADYQIEIEELAPDLVAPTCLCRPCDSDSDCSSCEELEALCISYGVQGAHCASRCDWVNCPPGYNCLGPKFGLDADFAVCVRADGVCPCTETAVMEEAATSCASENKWGICLGSRQCGPDGLSDCSGAEPAPDDCDGEDNDCDGETDEDFVPFGCVNYSEDGTCPGTTACSGGTLACVGQEAAPEKCDGIDNDCDGIFDNGFPDTDWDLTADCVDDDDDGDLVPDFADNCPLHPNPVQEDHDTDGLGDPCDDDDDNDGTPDDDDCAPLDVHRFPEAEELCDAHDCDCDGEVDEGFTDSDHDKLADCVDLDDDNDGALDESDCAPIDASVHPDAPETCDGLDNDCSGTSDDPFPDADDDGLADCVDVDTDGDGLADIEDNCPVQANEGQTDLDQDGTGDACDPDPDGDGVPSGLDNCPATANPTQTDSDGDGEGDACSDDDDGDGVPDTLDNCPTTGPPDQADWDGDMLGDICDADDDDDGVPDLLDCAPQEPAAAPGFPEVCDGLDNDCDFAADEGFEDSDNDGIADCADPDDDDDGHADAGDCDPLNVAIHPQAPESCNGVDDDCNGLVDDGFGTQECGKGQCKHTTQLCAGGMPWACDPFQGATVEICDGLDNDCDGVTDELFDVGAWCSVGFGACTVDGVIVCNEDGEGSSCDVIPPSPDCSGKVCGDDACGGSCGNCDDGFACTTDLCLPSGECGSQPAPGFCLVDGKCRVEDESYPASPCLYCDPSVDPEGWTERDNAWLCGPGKHCFEGLCCDAAGGCTAKECGADGCGDSCGECPEGLQCAEGLCKCIPDCAGKECGADGCGGSCGNCSALPGSACMPDGSCCVPDCDGKECGWDGCGLGCGACSDSLHCTVDECVDGTCQSTLKSGYCVIGDVCRSDGYVNKDNKCEHCDTAVSTSQWSVRPNGSDCDPKLYNKKWVCYQGTCCKPSCYSQGQFECGNDGCGDTCGGCPEPGYVCQDHECACQLDCEGKACGPDGSKGECGSCGAMEECRGSQCVSNTCSDGNGQDWDGCTGHVISEFRVNSDTVGDQRHPEVAPLSSGGFVVIWEHREAGGSAGEIRGRIVNSAGQTAGEDFFVSAFSGKCDPEPSIAHLTSGRLVAAWVDKAEDGKSEVRVQRLWTDGALEGEMMVASPEALNNYPRRYPRVVPKTTGGFTVFYANSGFGTSGWYHVFARPYGPDEVTPGDLFVVAKQGSNPQWFDAVGLEDGRILVSWRQPGYKIDLTKSVFVSEPGQVEEGVAEETDADPAVHTLAGQDAILRISREENPAGYYQLRLRAFDLNGEATSDPVWVHEHWTLGGVQGHDVSGFPDGDALAVWSWEDYSDGRPNVHAQLLNPWTGTLEHRFRLNTYTPYDQEEPAASGGNTGNALVVWQSCPHEEWPQAGQDGDGCGIFGRLFSPAGASCLPGECDPSCTVSCDDSQSCTDDQCIFGDGCTHQSSQGVCGEGNAGQCYMGLCCHPDCSDTQCGSDGCGGSCGACGEGEKCVNGACFATACDDGNAILWDGCSYEEITEFRLGAENKGVQEHPCVVELPSDLYGAAWAGNGPGDSDGVFLRRFSAGSGPVGEEVLVNETVDDEQRHPRLARGQSRLLAVWESEAQDGSDWGVFARYLDFTGTATGPEFQVNESSSGPQEGPSAQCRADDTCLVLFVSANSVLSDKTLYLRWVEPNGAPSGSQQYIAPKAGSGRSHDAAFLSSGGFVVTYAVQDPGDNMLGVRLQRFGPDSQKDGPVIVVNTFLPNSQSRPSVAVLSGGHIAIAWTSYESWGGPGGQDGDQDGAFARVFKPDGTPVGIEFALADVTAKDQMDPVLVPLADGGFGVVFQGHLQTGTSYKEGVLWRRFAYSGVPTGDAEMLNWQEDWGGTSPHAVSLSDGSIFAAWSNQEQDGFLDGVYGVRIDPRGARLFK